jgi:protein gp37
VAESSIEWTELTWNPTTGCDKLSAGCKFCYAEVMSRRLHAMGVEKYRHNFKITVHPDTLKDPFAWSGNRLVFVNSMSDLFHEAVPLTFIMMVFEVMNLTPQHTYQVLTKRADRLAEVTKHLDWTPNIWMGVSVEDKRVLHRMDGLRSTPAHVKFLSCEPLIGPLSGMNLRGIDWVIVGGESGRKPRSMQEEWVLDIKQQCAVYGVDFFFKQWGGTNKKKAGRVLEGRTWDAMPMMA